MTRVLSISSAGGSLEMGRSSGVFAKANVRGTGLPPVSLQWFEGAGNGKQYQGGRTLSRTIDLPIKIEGADRSQVSDRFRQVARILTLENAPVRLVAELDNEAWYVDCVRSGGGDFDWGVDTDGVTYVRTVITVEAGSPYWERVDAESRSIAAPGAGLGLLGPGVSLAQLQLATTESMGQVEITNTGDVDAWPTWNLVGPFDGFTLASGSQVLDWTGTIAAGGSILVDSLNGVITDDTGLNRYTGLAPSPRFWSVPPGSTLATISLDNPTGASRVDVTWHPRRLLVF